MACVTSGFTCHKCFCTRTNTTANMCVFAVKLCKFYYRRKSSESLERQRRRWQHQQAATREKKKTLFVCLSLHRCRRSVRACLCAWPRFISIPAIAPRTHTRAQVVTLFHVSKFSFFRISLDTFVSPHRQHGPSTHRMDDSNQSNDATAQTKAQAKTYPMTKYQDHIHLSMFTET